MQLTIDLADLPPSAESIRDLTLARSRVHRELDGISTWTCVLAIIMLLVQLVTSAPWASWVFLVSLVVGLVSSKAAARLRKRDAALLDEVPAELASQLNAYCTVDDTARKYHAAVLLQGRRFIRAEYTALQQHAVKQGYDGGMSTLYAAVAKM